MSNIESIRITIMCQRYMYYSCEAIIHQPLRQARMLCYGPWPDFPWWMGLFYLFELDLVGRALGEQPSLGEHEHTNILGIAPCANPLGSAHCAPELDFSQICCRGLEKVYL